MSIHPKKILKKGDYIYEVSDYYHPKYAEIVKLEVESTRADLIVTGRGTFVRFQRFIFSDVSKAKSYMIRGLDKQLKADLQESNRYIKKFQNQLKHEKVAKAETIKEYKKALKKFK